MWISKNNRHNDKHIFKIIKFIYILIAIDSFLLLRTGTCLCYSIKGAPKLFKAWLKKNVLNDTLLTASVICLAFSLDSFRGSVLVYRPMRLSWFHHQMYLWLYKLTVLTYHWDLSTSPSSNIAINMAIAAGICRWFGQRFLINRFLILQKNTHAWAFCPFPGYKSPGLTFHKLNVLLYLFESNNSVQLPLHHQMALWSMWQKSHSVEESLL